jgi:hypothetical protein
VACSRLKFTFYRGYGKGIEICAGERKRKDKEITFLMATLTPTVRTQQQSVKYHNPEEQHLNTNRCENLPS